MVGVRTKPSVARLERAPSPTTRIRYKYPDNGATTRSIHVLHHESLVLDTMLVAVTSEGEPAPTGSALAEEFSRIGAQWATDELMKFGIVSLYHLWERQMKTLITEQGLTLDLRKAKGANDADKLLRILEHELLAPPPQQARVAIEECRQITNAIKHDPGTGYPDLECRYPMHFVAGIEAAEDRFRVTPQDLRRLCQAIATFWEHLPVDIDYAP